MPDLESIISSSIAAADTTPEGASNAFDAVDESGTADATGSEGEETDAPSGETTEGTGADDAAVAVEGAATTTEKPKKWIRRDQAQKELAAAQATAKTQLDALQARVTALAQFDTQETKDKIRALEIAEQRPDAFINALMTDNRYPGLMLAALKANPQFAAEFAAAQRRDDAATVPNDRPKPGLMSDGTTGYTEEGLNALLSWERKQAVDEALKQAEEKFGKKYDEVLNPIKEEREAREKYGVSLQRTGAQITAARKDWPLFTDNEPKIKNWLNDAWKTPEGKRATLHDAYVAVVVKGVIQPNRDTMRQEILSELRAARGAGEQVKRPAASTGSPATGGKRSIESVIMNSIRGLDAAA